MDYQPALEDSRFLLFDVLDAPGQLRPAVDAEMADRELLEQVLEEAAFATAACSVASAALSSASSGLPASSFHVKRWRSSGMPVSVRRLMAMGSSVVLWG